MARRAPGAPWPRQVPRAARANRGIQADDQKLEEGFKLDFTVLEAWAYAGISKTPYYDRLAADRALVETVPVGTPVEVLGGGRLELEIEGREIVAAQRPSSDHP